MRAVWVLAMNTYREVIRDRILYGLIFFAVLFIGVSLVLGQLSFAEQARISANFGLSAIHLAAVALAIFVGSNLVYKEIDKKTILTILVRPITRLQFILGKALGLSLLILTMILGLAAILFAVFWFLGLPMNERLLFVLAGLLCESLILLGITLVFSMITRPILVVCMSIGIFMIGHWQDSLKYFAEKAGGGLAVVYWFTSRFVPNLERVNWKDLVLYDMPIEAQAKFMAMAYSLAWLGFSICLAALLFRKKDVG